MHLLDKTARAEKPGKGPVAGARRAMMPKRPKRESLHAILGAVERLAARSQKRPITLPVRFQRFW
jgi:hypothetical protein